MSVSQNYPIIAPSLLLDFSSVQALDSRITFARATTATYYGTRTAKAEQNLVLYSQEFDNAYWNKNNVTVTANATTAPNGTVTAEEIVENSTSNPHGINNNSDLNLAAGTYTESCFFKAGTRRYVSLIISGSSTADYVVATFDLVGNSVTKTGVAGTGVHISSSITDAGNGWYRCVVSGSITNLITYFLCVANTTGTPTYGAYGREIYTGDGVSNFYLWGAQLEQRSTVTAYQVTTTQPVTNYIPVLETAASGVARFDHNPVTFESLGLLIEEQRTNLLTYSEQFDNAAWTKTNSSVTANTIVAPDGTLSGDLFIPTSNSDLRQTITFAAATYTVSIYVKKAGIPALVGLNFNLAGTAGANGTVNIETGATIGVAGANFVSGASTFIGNGWYRVSATIINTFVGSTTLRIFPRDSSNNPITGDGYSGLYIWGAQLEAGAFSTSYIPTVASQVTRAADISTISGTNFSSWFNSQQGTVYCSFDSAGIGAPAMAYWEINNATNSVGYVLFRPSGNSTLQAYLGGSPANIGTITANTTQQAIFTYNNISPVTASGSLNGANPVAISSPSQLSFIPTRISIGSNRTTTESMTGHIRKLSYYPIAATSAQLQALTG